MYIGSTKSIKSRKYEHFHSLSKGKHHSSHLQKSYDKYGVENFIFYVLEECLPEVRKEREIHHIFINGSHKRDLGYNIYEPNEGNFKCSESTKNKIIDSHIKSGKSFPIIAYNNMTLEIIGEYSSIKECGKQLGINTSVVYEISISHKRLTYKGMTFFRAGESPHTRTSPKQRDMRPLCK